MNQQLIKSNAPVTVTVGPGAKYFQLALWLPILPGLIFKLCKLSAENHFHSLEQKIAHYNSQVQNYLEQRVVVLKNCAGLVNRATDLDMKAYECIARYRSGQPLTGDGMTQLSSELDALTRSIRCTVENHLELHAHQELQEALRQNLYLQKEVSAARELLNGAIYTWNREVFQWITYRIVAAEQGYATKPYFETTHTEPEDGFF